MIFGLFLFINGPLTKTQETFLHKKFTIFKIKLFRTAKNERKDLESILIEV